MFKFSKYCLALTKFSNSIPLYSNFFFNRGSNYSNSSFFPYNKYSITFSGLTKKSVMNELKCFLFFLLWNFCSFNSLDGVFRHIFYRVRHIWEQFTLNYFIYFTLFFLSLYSVAISVGVTSPGLHLKDHIWEVCDRVLRWFNTSSLRLVDSSNFLVKISLFFSK